MSDTTLRPDAIAAELRTRILDQREAPGASVTEASVAERFGVARPTARIAIDKLVAAGILQREAHRAARVPELGSADLNDVFDARAIVESAAMAALAVAGTIPADALAAHRSLASSDRVVESDIAFHRALVSGQHNTRLSRMHEQLMGEVELCIASVHAAGILSAAEIVDQHQGILEAITAGDAEAAADRARAHIIGAKTALLAHLKESDRG